MAYGCMPSTLAACLTAKTQAGSSTGPALAWVVAKSQFLLVFLIMKLFLVATHMKDWYPSIHVIKRSW